MHMIEGTWLGYRSSQDHVVHREYIPKGKDKKLVEWCSKVYCITFTDGTRLELRVKEVARKEGRVIDGYGKLIRDCFYAGVTSVAELIAKRKPLEVKADA